jgi:flagellar basal body-associated protein FliL
MNAYFNKHKLLFALAYVGIPALLAWIGYIVMDSIRTDGPDPDTISMSSSTALYELPRVALTMSAGVGERSGTMKLDIGIEVNRNEYKHVADYEPRIMERIFMYMHGQDYDQLREPDSARWIRTGLEEEIGRGAIPIHVASVVVQRMVFE